MNAIRPAAAALLNVPICALICVLLLALPRTARADTAPTTQPTSSPDKSQYTLFNPTPQDLLREMDTDRPNVTNTPHTIDAGHLQLETGIVDYAYYRDRAPTDDIRSDDLAFGEFNFRLGLLNNLEFNAIVNAVDIDHARDLSTGAVLRATGFGDTVVGGKLNLWGDDAPDGPWVTAFAIQPQIKIPTAPSPIGNGYVECLVNFPFQLTLPAGFTLAYQPAVADQRNTFNTGYTTAMINSICIDRVVVANLDVYAEYAAAVTTQAHTEAAQSIDVGGLYPLNDNTVLDAGVNFGLNRASTTIELLAGVSVRF